MFPLLIDLGTYDLPLLGETPLRLPTYGALFAAAALLAWWWFVRRARALGLDEERLFNLSFYALLSGILGAKLLLVVVDWRYYFEHPREILLTVRSAGVLVGGVVAGALVFTVYARRQGWKVLPLADAAAAPVALAQAVGRLGCFSAGCCWGVAADPAAFWSVTFTDPVAHEQTGVPLGVALVPTQLIQMVYDLSLAVFLAWLWRRRPRPAGTVFWSYIGLYGVGRGVIEFWRGDAHRGLFLHGTVSTSQLFAVAGVALAVGMLVRGMRQRRRDAAA